MTEQHHPTFSPGPRRARHLGLLALLGLALGASLFFLYLIAGSRLDLQLAGPALGSPAAAPGEASDGRLQLEIASDRSRLLHGGDGLVRLELKLAGQATAATAARQPTDFVVVLDHSGSMGDYQKIEHAREAVIGLIDRLADDDRFALVIYDDRVETPIPLGLASPAARERWKAVVAEIGPMGGTNLAIGLDSGLGVLGSRSRKGTARLVLISDGLANQGDTSRDGLLGRATAIAKLATPVTAIGVGNDFDENLMGALADSGGGNFYFLRDAVALAEVFEGELGATRETVAELVEIEVTLPPGVELVEAGGYPIERHGAVATFRPGSLFAGQNRHLWLTLKVQDGGRELGQVAARYRAGEKRFELAALAAPRVEWVKDEAAFVAGLDRERWSRAVVEEDFGKLQQKVADEVKAGNRAAAKKEIAAYSDKYDGLNIYVGSDRVTVNLEAARSLSAEVDDAFVGADQQLKQNSLSKTSQSAGWDRRRAGAKKLPAPTPPPPPQN